MFPKRVMIAATVLVAVAAASVSSGTASAQVGPGKAFVPGRLLIRFDAHVAPSEAQTLIRSAGAAVTGVIPGTGVQVLQLPPTASEVVAAAAFSRRPEVEFAELDRIVPPDAVPNDPYYAGAWHLPKVSAPLAWDTTTGDPQIIIAILDTGVDASHPDLGAKLVPGWNFYNNNADTADVHGHGTKVAGTAAAFSNNGAGVASLSWGSRIMPIRISDATSYATYSAMANGLTWAADRGARVANLSYRASESSTVTSAARYFQNKGGVVCSSAGNQSTFISHGDNPYVLTVSSSGPTDAVSSFSNTGNLIDVAAPGESIRTTFNGGGYGTASGTSFSSPIVAGVAALVMAVNPGLTPIEVQELIRASADDLGAPGWDVGYGAGRVNAAQAVNLARGGASELPDTTPPAVSFTAPTSGAALSGIATLHVSATDASGVSLVEFSAAGAVLATGAVAPYMATWDTNRVANGTYILSARAVDLAGNSGTTQVSVSVTNVVRDSTAPVVEITSPTAGQNVSGNVTVAARVVDDVGVTRLELYVDGVLTGSTTSAPFTTKWNARRASGGAHTLRLKAYDAAGNSGTSAEVRVYR